MARQYESALRSMPFPENRKDAVEQSSALLAFALTRVDAVRIMSID